MTRSDELLFCWVSRKSRNCIYERLVQLGRTNCSLPNHFMNKRTEINTNQNILRGNSRQKTSCFKKLLSEKFPMKRSASHSDVNCPFTVAILLMWATSSIRKDDRVLTWGNDLETSMIDRGTNIIATLWKVTSISFMSSSYHWWSEEHHLFSVFKMLLINERTSTPGPMYNTVWHGRRKSNSWSVTLRHPNMWTTTMVWCPSH